MIINTQRGVGYFIEQDAIEKILKHRKHQFLTKTASELLRVMRLFDISFDELKNIDNPKK